MLWQGLRLAFAAVLVVSAVAKLASPESSAAALRTFGIEGQRQRRTLWGALIAVELLLAAGVGAGLDAAAYAAAALLAGFTFALLAALRSGRAGAPCACFGSRSKVGWSGVVRNFGLATGFAALPLLPHPDLGTDQWLGLGIPAALLACAGLAIAVLALAREVGMLRLRLGPDAALEIEHEGPPVGQRSTAIDRFRPGPRAELALAAFASRGCRVCRGLEPAIGSLAHEPFLAVEVFEEEAEPVLWRELNVPGSPYAVAFDLDGLVLAKGTFNNLAQLESILATAEQRRAAIGGGGEVTAPA
ncbi:MAG: MauE/DoxX family redox-associated membrane protein [Actinomycetota bacterium]